jgi:hypothetical protein
MWAKFFGLPTETSKCNSLDDYGKSDGFVRSLWKIHVGQKNIETDSEVWLVPAPASNLETEWQAGAVITRIWAQFSSEQSARTTYEDKHNTVCNCIYNSLSAVNACSKCACNEHVSTMSRQLTYVPLQQASSSISTANRDWHVHLTITAMTQPCALCKQCNFISRQRWRPFSSLQLITRKKLVAKKNIHVHWRCRQQAYITLHHLEIKLSFYEALNRQPRLYKPRLRTSRRKTIERVVDGLNKRVTESGSRVPLSKDMKEYTHKGEECILHRTPHTAKKCVIKIPRRNN